MNHPASPRRAARLRAPIRALAALSLAALLSVPLSAQQQPGRTIVLGQVIDAQSKAPLAGVTVRLVEAGTAAVTAGDGQFVLRTPPGTYNVTVSRLGYATALEAWQVGTESLDVGIMELSTDAIRLEALAVTADRMERMRLASGIVSTAYGEVDLANTSFNNALQFVEARHSMYRVPCGSLATSTTSAGGECVRIRGGPVKVCVVVDEAPLVGGVDGLREFRPGELARLNVYRNGAFIQAYTTSFMRQRASINWEPMSVENQIIAFCRASG